MTSRFFLVFLFLSSAICTAQDNDTTKVNDSSEVADVPFAIIDNVPIYPGCYGSDNEILKKCMSEKIRQLVSENFNMKLVETLNLKPRRYRISAWFKIDKNGNVVKRGAYNRDSIPALNEEAIRVVGLIPKMKPGIQRGKAVGVLYALPIIFEVEPPKRTQSKKQQKKVKN